MEKKINVLITDDHLIFRMAVATALESNPDVAITGFCTNGEEAIEAAGALRPDVIIMDIHMGPVNGIEATSAIKSKYPDIKIIGYSIEPQKTLIQHMLDAGADGYITKTAPKDIIAEAVHCVMLGKKFIRQQDD